MATAKTTSRFLDLPAELRNRIYEFTFAGSATLLDVSSTGKRILTYTTSLGHRAAGLPALLHASRQLRRESQPMFYSSTSLVFRSFNDLLERIVTFDCPVQNALERIILQRIILQRNVKEADGWWLDIADSWYESRSDEVDAYVERTLRALGVQSESQILNREIRAGETKKWPRDGPE